MLKAQGSGEEHQMYQQQLEGLTETKSLCKTDALSENPLQVCKWFIVI